MSDVNDTPVMKTDVAVVEPAEMQHADGKAVEVIEREGYHGDDESPLGRMPDGTSIGVVLARAHHIFQNYHSNDLALRDMVDPFLKPRD